MKKRQRVIGTSAIIGEAFKKPLITFGGVFLFSVTSMATTEITNSSTMPPNVVDLFQTHCYQCHGQNGQNQGGIGSILDMTNLIHRGFITPGKPLLSTLIRKLKSGEMPLNGPQLKGPEIDLISAWIASLPSIPAKGQKLNPEAVTHEDGNTPVATLPKTTSVTQHHGNATRDGHFVEPTFTKDGVRALRALPNFVAKVEGDAFAQLLYVERASRGRDILVVATEKNKVYGFDGVTGAKIWEQTLGLPVPLKDLPCGNIKTLGITGTPVVDTATNTLLVDAMELGPNKSIQHWVHRLSLEDGSPQSGWPINVAQALLAKGITFKAKYQNQRGALLVLNHFLYVPYGGHYGDCGDYHGWVIGINLNSPDKINVWKTKANLGGIWAPGGMSSDGNSIFFATGNTDGAKTWGGGEGIFKLGPSLDFAEQPTEFFSPSNWKSLDDDDVDIGGTAPILVDVPGGVPSHLVVGLGKDGFIYVLDRENLGGIGKPIVGVEVSDRIITAPVTYTTSHGTYLVFKGHGKDCPSDQSGDLTALRINPTSPPTVSTAWCASQNGTASPIVTTTDGHSNAIVWGVGAEGDNKLHGIDGETGAVVFEGNGTEMDDVQRYQSAIVVSGRLFTVGGGKVYAFSIH